MAGTVFTNKADLLNALRARVFTNTSFAVTASGIETNDEDIVESLWDRGVPIYEDTTHAALTTLISTLSLTPGVLYRFPFETKHLVYGTTLANTQTPGYSPIVEHIYALALTTSTLKEAVVSEEHPEDIIQYNVAVTAVGSGTPVNTQGTIYHRHNTIANVEGFFDIRNHYVKRDGVFWSSVTQPGGGTPFTNSATSRGGFIVSTADDATKVRFMLDNNMTDANSGHLTGAFGTVSTLFSGMYPTGNILQFNGVVLQKAGAPTYVQTITGNCQNIKLGTLCDDVFIDSSFNIELGQFCIGVSIRNSADIIIGNSCSQILADVTFELHVGSYSSNILSNNNARAILGGRSVKVIMGNSQDISVDSNSDQLVVVNSYRCDFGKKVGTSIFTDFFDGKVGSYNNGISAGISMGTEIQDRCTDIFTIGGNYNLFETGCSTIRVDDRSSAISGITGYNAYSPMEYCIFGRGCENITFFNPSGIPFASGCYVSHVTFGARCTNLVFNGSVTHTSFCRGISNKTFEAGVDLFRTSFLTPSEATAVIAFDGMVQKAMFVWLPEYTLTGDPQYIPAAQLFGAGVVNVFNVAASSQNYSDRAFIWTYDGFPELVSLTRTVF